MNDRLSADLQSLRIQRGEPVRPPRSGVLWRVLLVLVVLGGGAAGAVVGWPYLEAQIYKAEVRTGEVSIVSPAQAATTLTATGYVVARTLSRVGARVPGRVSKVYVREGDSVRAGQVLLELEDADRRSAIAAARARTATARAAVATARAQEAEIQQQIARQRALVAAGAVGRAGLEDLEARARSLAAAVTAARAELRAADAVTTVERVALDDLRLVSPIDGTVINEPPEIGEAIGPQALESFVEIADFSSMVAEVDVPETRLPIVRVGGPSEITLDAMPGRRFRAATLEIGRRVNRAKATVPVRVRFLESTDGVLPDMAARVSFLAQELSAEQRRAVERTVVPASAVATRGGARVIFVVEEGRARVRRVRVGPREGDEIPLLDGPDPGTRVVLSPPPTLHDGQGVREERN
ncbi:MAG: efflux RND transporter periplasmic adaptor subunit [Deltaproteobacteria bacterium]|nr:efflux RND transporter periplasmic adaptor subunit [Deltaproteobacteria bacterium]